jgi:hypothetical protein
MRIGTTNVYITYDDINLMNFFIQSGIKNDPIKIESLSIEWNAVQQAFHIIIELG